MSDEFGKICPLVMQQYKQGKMSRQDVQCERNYCQWYVMTWTTEGQRSYDCAISQIARGGAYGRVVV